MNIYKLNRSYDHIVDKDHDIHLVPFEDSESLEYDLLNAELLKIPKPIYFIGYFQVATHVKLDKKVNLGAKKSYGYIKKDTKYI